MTLDILLVEDSPSDATLAAEALIDTGIDHKISLAEDGRKAIDYLEKAGCRDAHPVPDVILLDLNMPRVDGHGVLEAIRSQEKLNEVPVLVLTVSKADEDIFKALDLGMNFYLRKPVSLETLKAILEATEKLWNQ